MSPILRNKRSNTSTSTDSSMVRLTRNRDKLRETLPALYSPYDEDARPTLSISCRVMIEKMQLDELLPPKELPPKPTYNVKPCSVLLHRLPDEYTTNYSYILDMGDTALSQLLSLLPRDALTGLAMTCRRMRRIARSIFAARYAAFQLIVSDVLTEHKSNADNHIRHTFRIFGDLMINVDIHFTNDRTLSRNIFSAILRHCGAKTTTMYLRRLILDSRLQLVSDKTLFDTLRVLGLYKCSITDDALLSGAPQLTQIQVDEASLKSVCRMEFPRLICIAVRENNVKLHHSHQRRLLHFLQQHRKISEVYIKEHSALSVKQRLAAIAEQVHTSHGFYASLVRLTNLACLSISIENNSRYLISFLRHSSSADTLTHLDIVIKQKDVCSDFLKELKRFQRLRCLHVQWPASVTHWDLINLHSLKLLETVQWLNTTFSSVGLIKWIEQLPELQAMSITDTRGVIENQAYAELCALYQRRPAKLQLKLLNAPKRDIVNEEMRNVEIFYA